MKNRFVTLYHELPATSNRPCHWDLMLAIDDPKEMRFASADRPLPIEPDVLLTFEIRLPPHLWAPGMQLRQLPFHRRFYLDYQGEISQDRGCVKRIQSGSIVWLETSMHYLKFRLDHEADTTSTTWEISATDSAQSWLPPIDHNHNLWTVH
jgi:hypothetical protein